MSIPENFPGARNAPRVGFLFLDGQGKFCLDGFSVNCGVGGEGDTYEAETFKGVPEGGGGFEIRNQHKYSISDFRVYLKTQTICLIWAVDHREGSFAYIHTKKSEA